MNEMKCELCMYCEGELCHRYPPIIIKQEDRDGYEYMQSYHPMVDTDEWCGEFKRKTVEEE